MDSMTSKERTRLASDEIDDLKWGTLRDWGQLVRLPNSFTLISDTVAAALIVGTYLLPVTAFALTLTASFCAYWAGMILNDIVDLEEDRENRPSRPLPAGRISPVLAGHIANGMLLIGPLLILVVTNFHTSQSLWMGAAFASAALLSIVVRMYNSALKQTFLGPLLMGLCRSLNILMVGCTMLSVSEIEDMPRALLWFAGAIGLYIMGVTVYARREETDSNPVGLVFGLMIEFAAMVALAGFPIWSGTERAWGLDPNLAYPLLMGLIGFTVIQRGISGVTHPVPRKVQLAVKHAILTLILIDAAVAVMWAGPWFGGAVALMLLPALTTALRFRST
jgi:4-hydroxybenzoate polyprenyltransferase